MTLIDTFERAHRRELASYGQLPFPSQTLVTPDNQTWTPQSVLRGWRGGRISDRWAWAVLHAWVIRDEVTVDHLELPTKLVNHDPKDKAWSFIEGLFGPSIEEPLAHPIGRADLACGKHGESTLMIEFGTCTPAKFVINLGCSPSTHWMLVPYDSLYAFVFCPRRQLIGARGGEDKSK
jgi:hypothetical protein